MIRVKPLSKHEAPEATRPFMETAEFAAIAAMANYRARLNKAFLVESQGI